MPYETRENTGSIFPNKKKEKDTHPDRQGSCNIGGIDYWISGWVKTTDTGGSWLSLAFKPKDHQTAKPITEHSKAKGNAYQPLDLDDEIPF